MAVGSCFCGKIQIEMNGQPLTSGLCHCLDCRKLTGSVFSYSHVVKTADLKITGNPKAVAKTSDSGNHIRNYFCPDCGSPLFGRRVNPDGEPWENTIVRGGIFDDERLLNDRKPDAELFTTRRVEWVAPVEGTAQFCGMLPLP
ncbi:hypothetical protein BO70DRAFT_59353 [Aspergillus heteromorphus CBS 117.55]|uniref:CENP-V/GFA domain-containing protein n=1 Tax=Aspergillus heteromorphus CBS 117.55 TaxID=1448321 RepID=A0A317VV61_9EURO|nr:uncharacterized protein BO70DRAFT_59353 [Aspergillus heteromorphus CBS 117.55]PWY78193.1 hypothetical protein BO70DRAFT_59353 [Aspergillus heteromorphus CBS 117.55]